MKTVQLHRELNKYEMGVLSGNFTTGFFESFIITVSAPDIEGIQNKVICLWIGTTCSVNVASTCGANLYDIIRRGPSRRAPKMYKALSPYMLRHSLNVQICLVQKNILFNSFFRKAASLWNALPIVVKSSASFSTFKLHLETVTAGTFMVATPVIHRYAVDCAWVTVS